MSMFPPDTTHAMREIDGQAIEEPDATQQQCDEHQQVMSVQEFEDTPKRESVEVLQFG